jgi:hypothetical protein
LRNIRAKQEIVRTARWMLSLHDTGERVPETAWDELRLRMQHMDATGRNGDEVKG